MKVPNAPLLLTPWWSVGPENALGNWTPVSRAYWFRRGGTKTSSNAVKGSHFDHRSLRTGFISQPQNHNHCIHFATIWKNKLNRLHFTFKKEISLKARGLCPTKREDNPKSTKTNHGRKGRWTATCNAMLPANYRAFLGGDRQSKCLVGDRQSHS
jgi:hypothetical protein